MEELEAVAGNIAPCKALIARLRESQVIINVSVKETSECPFARLDFRHGISLISLPVGSGAQVLFHELLHIKRQRLDRLPFITVKPGTPEREFFDISVLGNNLHHAFILPEEFAAYPDALRYRADEFRQTLLDLHNNPSTIAGRDDWIAGMLFMTSQLIFPEKAGVTASLRQSCMSLGVDPRSLMLDARELHSEQSLFAQFRNAIHYPSHQFVSFSEFDENQAVRRL
jgi:hypothetical protein